jgi:hypothetical protein
MESEGERREVSKEHATMESGKAPSKRQREQHLAAVRRGKPKELTRGDCGSRRKLAAACRKVSRRARVVWRKRNIITNNWIRDTDEQGPQRVGALRKKLWTRHGGRRVRKGIGGRRPLYLRKDRAAMSGIRERSSGQRSYLGSG